MAFNTGNDGSSPLAWMLPYKLDTDDREPVIVVWAGTFVGLYIPSIFFWIQVLMSVGLQSILSALFSVVTYTQIIDKQHHTNTRNYMLGFGVLIPLWLVLPRWQLQVFGIQNMVINFCLSGIIPTLNIFHTMEGMFWRVGVAVVVVVVTYTHQPLFCSHVRLCSSVCSSITIRLCSLLWFSNDITV